MARAGRRNMITLKIEVCRDRFGWLAGYASTPPQGTYLAYCNSVVRYTQRCMCRMQWRAGGCSHVLPCMVMALCMHAAAVKRAVCVK